MPTPILLLAPRLSKSRRALIKISSYTEEVLVGVLLGDAWLQKRSRNQNTRFGFRQSSKEEKREYFNFIFNLFSIFCTPNYIPVVKTIKHSGYDTILGRISFVTMRLPCFNVYFELFYGTGKKCVPYNIEAIFTGVSLAHWIMCDGSKQNNGLHLNTYGFTIEDVNRLILMLKHKYDLNCTIHQHKAGPRIYILGDSIDKVRALVKPHMVPSMYYKIRL